MTMSNIYLFFENSIWHTHFHGGVKLMTDPLPNLSLNSSLTIAIAINSFHAIDLFLYSPEKIKKLLVF